MSDKTVKVTDTDKTVKVTDADTDTKDKSVQVMPYKCDIVLPTKRKCECGKALIYKFYDIGKCRQCQIENGLKKKLKERKPLQPKDNSDVLSKLGEIKKKCDCGVNLFYRYRDIGLCSTCQIEKGIIQRKKKEKVKTKTIIYKPIDPEYHNKYYELNRERILARHMLYREARNKAKLEQNL